VYIIDSVQETRKGIIVLAERKRKTLRITTIRKMLIKRIKEEADLIQVDKMIITIHLRGVICSHK
jgi:hypothetical protein